MYEIRLHGLGGEGVVRLSEIIGKATVDSGKYAHSFPFFGTEIRGAAVKAFTRVDDKPITVRSYIYEPDVLVLTNDILLDNPDVSLGIKPDTIFVVSTKIPRAELEKKFGCTVYTVNAVDIAYEVLGRPITNTIVLGALIAATGIISMEAAEESIRTSFPAKIAEKNITALHRGYDAVKEGA